MRLLGNIFVVDPLPLLSDCPSPRVDLSVLSGRRTRIVNHIDSFWAFLSSRASGPIKSPGQSLVGAASDRTPSFSLCAIAVELGPHHGTPIRYPCPAAEAMGMFGRGPGWIRRSNFALATRSPLPH